VRAYAFLRSGALDYLSQDRWPAPSAAGDPGDWLAPAGGVRATRLEHLPWWLDDELWEVELAGVVNDAGRSLRADRGRLLRRVDLWDADVALELRDVCLRRLREHAERTSGRELAPLVDDAAKFSDEAADPTRGAAVAAFVAAHAAGGGDDKAPGYETGFAAERAWQADWLSTRLRL
jgi:hypothetical protein